MNIKQGKKEKNLKTFRTPLIYFNVRRRLIVECFLFVCL